MTLGLVRWRACEIHTQNDHGQHYKNWRMHQIHWESSACAMIFLKASVTHWKNTWNLQSKIMNSQQPRNSCCFCFLFCLFLFLFCGHNFSRCEPCFSPHLRFLVPTQLRILCVFHLLRRWDPAVGSPDRFAQLRFFHFAFMFTLPPVFSDHHVLFQWQLFVSLCELCWGFFVVLFLSLKILYFNLWRV